MNTITTISDTRFSLNGVEYLKNYVSVVHGQKVEVFNCYERKDVLLALTHYSHFSVNGSAYDNAEELQAALLEVIYTRSTLGEGGAFDQNNTGRKINLGLFLGDDTDAGTSFEERAAARLNSRPAPIVVTEKQTPVILWGLYSTQNYGEVTEWAAKLSFLLLAGKGTYGEDGIQISAGQLWMLPPMAVLPEDILGNEDAVIIPLGEITEDAFLAAANTDVHDFTDTDIQYYFSYSVPGEGEAYILYLAMFIGASGVYGDENIAFTRNDFAVVTNTQVPPVVIPSLQQVTDAGNTSTTPVTIAGEYATTTITGDGIDHQHLNGFKESVRFAQPVAEVEYTIPAKPFDDVFAFKTDLNGLTMSVNQAAAELYLKNGEGNVLATINVGFLNNEGTTFYFNELTQNLELKNDAGNILSTIPVSAFVTNLIQSINFNGSTPSILEFKDASGDVVDSVQFTVSNVSGLQAFLDSKAPLASPALTGTPTAPTAVSGTNTTQIATTAFVQNEAVLKGGNATNSSLIIGTKVNNQNIEFIINNVTRALISAQGILLPANNTISNSPDNNVFSLSPGNSTTPASINRNTVNDVAVLDIVNLSNTSTGDIINFKSIISDSNATRAGVRKDGRVFAAHGVSTNDLVTVGQLNSASSATVAQTITDGVTTSAPSQNVVYDALQLKANADGSNATGTWSNITAGNSQKWNGLTHTGENVPDPPYFTVAYGAGVTVGYSTKAQVKEALGVNTKANDTDVLHKTGDETKNGKLQIVDGVGDTPVLGSGWGKFKIGNELGAYGLQMGVLGNGNVVFQAQRTDGSLNTYDIELNTFGGNVRVRDGVSSKHAVNKGQLDSKANDADVLKTTGNQTKTSGTLGFSDIAPLRFNNNQVYVNGPDGGGDDVFAWSRVSANNYNFTFNGNQTITGYIHGTRLYTSPLYAAGGGFYHKVGSNINSRSWRQVTDSNIFGDWSLQVSTDNTGESFTSNVLYATKEGNVGVGTNSPTTKLDVNGGVRIVEDLKVESSILLPGTRPIYFNDLNWAFAYSSVFGGMNLTKIGVADGVMFAKDNLNVGVGTTNPQIKLDVKGNLGSCNTVNNSGMVLNTNSTSIPVLQGTDEPYTNPKDLAINYFGGNVSVGNTIPDAKFHVTGGDVMTYGWKRTALLEANLPVIAFKSLDKYAGIGYDSTNGESSLTFWLNSPTSDLVASSPKFAITNSGNAIFRGAVSGYNATANEHFVPLGQMNTALGGKANDADVVKLTTNQTVSGNKIFNGYSRFGSGTVNGLGTRIGIYNEFGGTWHLSSGIPNINETNFAIINPSGDAVINLTPDGNTITGGNIGIGTHPGFALDVRKTGNNSVSRVFSSSTDQTYGQAFIQSFAGRSIFGDLNSNTPVHFLVGSNDRAVIRPDGKFLIGYTTPSFSHLLQVNGGAYINGSSTVNGKLDVTSQVSTPQVITDQIYIANPATVDTHGVNLLTLNSKLAGLTTASISTNDSYVLPINGREMFYSYKGNNPAEWRLPDEHSITPGTQVTVINKGGSMVKVYSYDTATPLLWEAGSETNFINVAVYRVKTFMFDGDHWIILP